VKTLALVILALMTTTAAFGQTRESRGSAAAAVGRGRTWDDEGEIGSGVVAGGRIDWRIVGHTRAELALDSLGHDRSGIFAANGRTTLTSASIVQRFGAALAQPYALGGLTVAHHNGTTTFDNRTTSHSSTDLGYHFGGGVAVRVGAHVEIGPEVRFYIIQADQESSPAWASWAGVRFGVGF